ncbi:MAG TPA: hypothetical protein VGL53_25010 [Bryobacteraceae bacterium]
MNRRGFIFLLTSSGLVVAKATESTASLRGRLKAGDPAAIIASNSPKPILLTGDSDTNGVLGDARLDGTDFEVLGHFTDPGHFDVDKIHTRSLFVHKDGKRLMVTYWCDVCYIRTYTPGKCWCCQKYTDLDLRESIPDE